MLQYNNLVLTTNIPHSEVNIFVFHCLYVKTYGRNGCNDFTKFKLIEYSCLKR